MIDMTVLTDMKLSSSAAHAIAERTRFAEMDRFPNEVLDVLVGKTKYSSLVFVELCRIMVGVQVRTQSAQTVCPLLSRTQKVRIIIKITILLIMLTKSFQK